MQTCFVVMGFGVKTDYQTGRKLDLDKSYQNVIKPAVEAAGLKCVRADEIQHAGVIDKPMYQQLLEADLVVADVSTMNPNAFYELGVRHALRPHTTIIMAESELAFPFDINRNVIRRYKHLGEDIGASEARRATQDLTEAIRAIQTAPEPDSPVYTFLQNLAPPHLAKPVVSTQAIPAPAAMAPPTRAFRGEGTGDGNVDSVGTLLEQAKKAREKGEWKVAAFLLQQLKEGMEKGTGNGALDPYIIQQLALATYKSDNTEPGLRKACDILETLHPENSKDPETLGLWGAIHKRLWDVTGDRITLDKALRAYEIGFTVRNDYYTGINYAIMLNIRASATQGDDAVADRVMAKRVRQRVIASCDELLKEELTAADRYWALATQAEAYFGIGELEQSRQKLADAAVIVPEPWMLNTTKEQIQRLGALLGTADLPWVAKAGAPG